MPLQIQTLQKAVQSNIVALPQGAAANIFAVTGDVLIVAIQGVVTTVIGSVANATKFQAKCGALATTDLCATADINALAAGAIMQPITSFATAMSIAATAGILVVAPGATSGPTGFMMMCGTTGAGVLIINCAGSDGGTGRVRFTCLYQPLSNGAQIVSS